MTKLNNIDVNTETSRTGQILVIMAFVKGQIYKTKR